MTSNNHGPLGTHSDYPRHYDPGLLFPIARARGRSELGLSADAALPFHGIDLWNAYELSWLDRRGKPMVAIASFGVPAQSPNLIESKSFKLYLNSFNQERVDDPNALQTRLVEDLSRAAGAAVTVELSGSDAFARQQLAELQGLCIDSLEIDVDDYGPPQPQYLRCGEGDVRETLVSHLLKSNCPVTGQPDWASVQVSYRGAAIDHAGLLRYLVSFRNHAGFHEQCVERIFIDLQRQCAPRRLSVYARYTRRGGLDINPWRSSEPGLPANPRGARQ